MVPLPGYLTTPYFPYSWRPCVAHKLEQFQQVPSTGGTQKIKPHGTRSGCTQIQLDISAGLLLVCPPCELLPTD